MITTKWVLDLARGRSSNPNDVVDGFRSDSGLVIPTTVAGKSQWSSHSVAQLQSTVLFLAAARSVTRTSTGFEHLRSSALRSRHRPALVSHDNVANMLPSLATSMRASAFRVASPLVRQTPTATMKLSTSSRKMAQQLVRP